MISVDSVADRFVENICHRQNWILGKISSFIWRSHSQAESRRSYTTVHVHIRRKTTVVHFRRKLPSCTTWYEWLRLPYTTVSTTIVYGSRARSYTIVLSSMHYFIRHCLLRLSAYGEENLARDLSNYPLYRLHLVAFLSVWLFPN